MVWDRLIQWTEDFVCITSDVSNSPTTDVIQVA